MDNKCRDKDWLRDKYWNEKLSLFDIADICNCSGQAILYWMNKHDIPRRDFMIYPDLESSSTLAYILGITDSDGCVYKDKQGSGLIQLQVKDEPFAQSFADALENIGLHSYFFFNNGYYRVKSCSIKFYQWYDSLSITDRQDLAESYPKQYLKGFYEGDGSRSSEHLQFDNTDLDYITLIESLLDDLKFEHSRYTYKYKDKDFKTKYTIAILGGSSERNRFLNMVQPCIRNKQY